MHPNRPAAERAAHFLAPIALLLVVYAAVRMPFLNLFLVVSFDGTVYLNQAKAFFSGTDPQGGFPVGYPLSVALLAPFTNIVRAGQLVSVLAGFGAIVFYFLIARRYLDRRLALASALWLACVPLFIRMTLITMSEALYLFWVLMGFYVFLREKYLLAGLALGAAAITRPEALAIWALLCALRIRQVRSLMTLIGSFVVVYSLNVLYYRVALGQMELLPKRKLLGASAGRFEREELLPGAESPADTATGLVDISIEFLKRTPQELWALAMQVSPLVALLALYGAIRKRNLLLFGLVPFLSIPLFAPRSEVRFLFPHVPIIVLFAFIGAAAIRRRRWRRGAYGLLAICLAFVIVTQRHQLADPVDDGFYELRSVGRDLRDHIPPNSVFADRKPYVAFYANGIYDELPLGSYESTLDHIAKSNADFVVLHYSITFYMRPSLKPLLYEAEFIRGEPTLEQHATYFNNRVLIYKRVSEDLRPKWERLTESRGREWSPSWSPDGESIAFVSDRAGNSDIFVAGVNTAAVTQLTDWASNEDDPEWSPDGKRLAFTSDRNGFLTLYVLEVATGRIAPLITEEAEGYAAAWSAQTILFGSERGGESHVWAFDRKTGRTTQISTESGTFPSATADGDRYAWVRPGGPVFLYDPASGNTRECAMPKLTNYSPVFSPDGGYIAVTGRDWGSPDVYVIKSDGSSALQLTRNPGFDGQPTWSPDGRRVALSSEKQGPRSIWIIDNFAGLLPRLDKRIHLAPRVEPED